jgi:hypothetical protein
MQSQSISIPDVGRDTSKHKEICLEVFQWPVLVNDVAFNNTQYA